MNSKLIQCFIKVLGITEEEIKDDLAYNSIPQWDSTRHMALIAVIESEFDIMLDTDDIVGMSSFAKAKEIVSRYL